MFAIFAVVLGGLGPLLWSLSTVISPTERLTLRPTLGPTLGLSQASAAEDWCYTVESMQVLLAERYGEAVVFSGTAADGRSMTLFASAAGSWTLFQVDVDGAACPIASGENGRLPKGPVFIQLNPEDPA